MQLCDEAPKYLIVLVAIKQLTPFLRLSRVLLSLYILQIRPSALTRFCPKTSLPDPPLFAQIRPRKMAHIAI